MITINIKEEIWEYLNKQKKPGETFNQVLIRKLKIKLEDKKDEIDNKLVGLEIQKQDSRLNKKTLDNLKKVRSEDASPHPAS